MSLESTSYMVAGALFLLLTVLLAFGWKGRPQGAPFIIASLVTTLWAAVLAVQGHWESLPLPVIYLAEIAHSAAWLFVLLAVGAAAIPRTLRLLAYLLCATVVLVSLVLLVFGPKALFSISPPVLFSHSGLALALCGLILLEQIYRNSEAGARVSLRPLVFGIGGLFAYDLFLYSQAELFRGIGADSWNARGLVNAMLAPLIAVAVRRNPEWSLHPFVSRQVAFYTGTLVAVGVYLLLMSLGGYYVRSIGGSWGGIAQILFLVGALAVLASLVFSSSLRARFRVFLSKHFYRNKYDYRAEWLRFIQTLSSTGEGDVGRTALRAVAQIFSCPGGMLFLAGEQAERFEPVARWPSTQDIEPAVQALAKDDDLPRFLRERQWIVDLQEYRNAPDFYGRLQLPAWLLANPGLRIVLPLLEQDRLIGFMVLSNPPAAFQLTYEDRDLLKTVGRHVATQIAQHQADAKLTESRQFEAYNRLTAFMMHDLKNSVAQLKLLVANAEKHKSNPAFFDDAISTIANTVERMNRLIAQLGSEAGASAVRTVDVEALARSAVARCAGRRPVPELEVDAEQRTPLAVRASADRLASVIENVLRNAQDATPETGSVVLRLVARDGEVEIGIIDSGMGMDEKFLRERLFRPFDSTKGSKGMGVGAYQVREYIRSLGGEVEVQSTPGRGTVFSIRLAACPMTNQNS